jgi:hypothetical protein
VERYFLWRAESFLIYDDVPDEYSRQYVERYFDQELLQHGWERSEYFAPCALMMPEANFINVLPDTFTGDYFLYRRPGDNIPTYGDITSDFVCIAVWSDSPGVFHIVILTAKPSPLTIFWNNIFQ